MSENQFFSPQDIETNKVYALLAYLGILFLVPLLAAKESPYAKFHTNQGLVLFTVEAVLGVAYLILSVVLGFIPYVGVVLIGLMSLVMTIGPMILAVMGIVNAAQGKAKELPVIGSLTILK